MSRIWNWPILHDKELHHPHSHHTIHIYELAMPIYVIITTVPILLILGNHISWKLSPVNLLTQASIGGNFSLWCCLTFAAWLPCVSQLGSQKWRLSGPFQLHLYTSLKEIHSNEAYIMQILWWCRMMSGWLRWWPTYICMAQGQKPRTVIPMVWS